MLSVKLYSSSDFCRCLSHKNVVSFIDYIEPSDGNDIWLVTEYIDGGSMRRFCTGPEKNSIDIKDKMFIAKCCWNGLAYLHSRLICHKDIKPENILVRIVLFIIFSDILC